MGLKPPRLDLELCDLPAYSLPHYFATFAGNLVLQESGITGNICTTKQVQGWLIVRFWHS